MKNLFVIETHSFVDLITNSSSELFICDTQKTRDAVENLLRALLCNHNDLRETPGHYAFSEVFGEVKVADFTYDESELNPEILRQIKSYDKWRENSRGEACSRPESYYEAELLQKELDATHPYLTEKWSDWDDRLAEEKDRYENARRDYWNKEREIWTKYGAERLALNQALFVDYLRKNCFSDAELAKVQKVNETNMSDYIANKHGEYGRLNYEEGQIIDNARKAFELFDECHGWNLRVRKGNVLVRSQDDNSIPYGLFDLIEEYLHARRYHLG